MTDLSALKELAKKAHDGNDVSYDLMQEAAYPEVILQLCEVVEKAREVVAGWHTTVCDSAEERALRSALADLGSPE